ncbi:hypothetical protein GOP47_0012655 [Adiantum capillus-veneris]|uniref:Jacalin-type lectin domain-containing protein n=1 Tax=Adiantum capillus-veneris TaxID=13818 RepID=A0A9D4ZEL9_ADICA|nr:hypothetical protein GOP47_0012655 [Adiantum capillus-veneris]
MNDKRLQEFNKSVKVQVGFHQRLRGVSAATPIPKPSNMLGFALDFPTFTIDSPVILRRELLGYEDLPFFGAAVGALGRNRYMFSEDADFMGLLAQVKSLNSYVEDLRETLQTYGLYKGSGAGKRLDQVTAALEAESASLKKMLQEYKEDVMKEVKRPAKFLSLSYASRVRSANWTQHKTKYLGGMGGASHAYVKNVGGFMSAHRRIVAVAMRAEGCVDQISIHYDNGDKFVCGGPGGQASPILYLDDGVHFSEICIQANRWGEHNHVYISYLQFTLTNGISIAGGSRHSSPHREAIYTPCQNYHYFCGFDVKSGKYVDGLRAIFAKFVI